MDSTDAIIVLEGADADAPVVSSAATVAATGSRNERFFILLPLKPRLVSLSRPEPHASVVQCNSQAPLELRLTFPARNLNFAGFAATGKQRGWAPCPRPSLDHAGGNGLIAANKGPILGLGIP